ncbi:MULTISPECIES: hypothetical protein [Caballeronia]|uniref:hypothetical protein n=1 Tax=Caballeronia TaxID=1827195 RepID=UPI00286D3168|nr:hypothetical protein [Caballeronia sp. LZ025]
MAAENGAFAGHQQSLASRTSAGKHLVHSAVGEICSKQLRNGIEPLRVSLTSNAISFVGEISAEDQLAYCARLHPLFARAGRVTLDEAAEHDWAWRSYPLPGAGALMPRSISAPSRTT